MPKMLLPDVNVWLAMAFDGHVHHQVAKQWFDSLESQVCYFCRLTQQGFLRLATNPKVFKDDALTMVEAWQTFDHFLTDPRITFTGEPKDLEDLWRSFTARQTLSPQMWNDAYLASLAEGCGMELVTFDKGLSQYPRVACTVLR